MFVKSVICWKLFSLLFHKKLELHLDMKKFATLQLAGVIGDRKEDV